MSKIKDKITPDQKRVIGMGLLDYLLTQLNVDQLGNWNDLHYVYEDIGHTAVKFNPEVAGKIRYYYENLSSDFIHYYLECTSRGMINGHVYSRESQDNIDKINSGEDVTTERHYNKHGGEENLLPYQEEWKAHLLKVTQNELKGETVTPETLDEIYQYDVLLGVLSGARYWYFEKMDDQACGNILRLLEFNMGIPLPELRGRIAQMKSKKFVEDIKPLEITAITQEKMLTGETEPADRKYEAYIILHPDLAKTHLDNEWYQYNEFCMKPDLDRHIEEGGKVYVLPYKDVNDSSEMIKSYLDTDNVTVMEPLSHEAGLVPAGIDQFKLQYTKLKIEMYEDRINKTKLVGVTHNQSEYDLGKCLGTSSFDRYPEELFRAVCSYFNIAVSFPKADGTKHFFGPEELGERLHYYDVSLAKDYDSLFLHKTETYP